MCLTPIARFQATQYLVGELQTHSLLSFNTLYNLLIIVPDSEWDRSSTRSSYYWGTMLSNTYLAWAACWGALISFTKGKFEKTRLCIQYEIDDYNSTLFPLKQISGVTRNACFIECVRYQRGISPCRAFHFRQSEGICELLPDDNDCMPDTTSPGTKYVHLSDCQSVPPWHRLNPSPGSWQWESNPVSLSDAIKVTSPLGAVRYVVRVLHKGMWLPGWEQYSRANVAGPDGVTFTCRANIQYITFSDPARRRWDSFVVGDPVPSAAIVAGYWPNGAPLYILRLATDPYSAVFAAYYDAESFEIMPRFNDIQPPSIKILVSTG